MNDDSENFVRFKGLVWGTPAVITTKKGASYTRFEVRVKDKVFPCDAWGDLRVKANSLERGAVITVTGECSYFENTNQGTGKVYKNFTFRAKDIDIQPKSYVDPSAPDAGANEPTALDDIPF